MQTFFHSWQTILFLTQSNQRVLSLRLANDVSDDAASTILRLAMLVAAKQTHRRAKFVFVSVRCANENVDEPTAWSWSLFKQRVIVLPSQSTRRFLVMSTQLFELMRLLIALDGENNNRIFDVRQTEQREALVFDVPFFFLKKKKQLWLEKQKEFFPKIADEIDELLRLKCCEIVAYDSSAQWARAIFQCFEQWRAKAHCSNERADSLQKLLQTSIDAAVDDQNDIKR